MRLLRSLSPVLVLLLLLPALAAADGPRLRPVRDSIAADEELHWTIPFSLVNDREVGLYPDSLWFEVEDLGPGRTGGPRRSAVPVQQLLRIISNVSAQDSTFFQYEGPALLEHARVTFRLLAHDPTGKKYDLAGTVMAGPGPATERFPSRFLTVDGRRVETVFVPAREDSALSVNAPGVLLIAGEGTHARMLLAQARVVAHRGYAVMIMSPPGYGLSEGDPDFAGPASVKAAAAALEALGRTGGVDPKRLAAWGVSRSAAVAVLLAERRPGVLVVAESGAYDLWAVARGTTSEPQRAAIVAEAGRDSAAWRERSPAARPGAPGAAVLLLHGEQDPEFPVAQARSFAAALTAGGAQVDTQFVAQGHHVLPRGTVNHAVLPFLGRELHP